MELQLVKRLRPMSDDRASWGDLDHVDRLLSTSSYLLSRGLDRAAGEIVSHLRGCDLLPGQRRRLGEVATEVLARLSPASSTAAPLRGLPRGVLAFPDRAGHALLKRQR